MNAVLPYLKCFSTPGFNSSHETGACKFCLVMFAGCWTNDHALCKLLLVKDFECDFNNRSKVSGCCRQICILFLTYSERLVALFSQKGSIFSAIFSKKVKFKVIPILHDNYLYPCYLLWGFSKDFVFESPVKLTCICVCVLIG